MCAGPVHLRAIAREHVVPDHRPASGDGLPVRYLLGMRKHFFHLVAGAEAQLLKVLSGRVGIARRSVGQKTAETRRPMTA
jgi:hypothetical protein